METTALLDSIIAAQASDVLQAVIDAAKGGDLRASEMVLSRVWPSRKSAARTFELRSIKTAEDIAGALDDVLAAVTGGRLTIDEGASVTEMVEAHRKAMELIEFAKRLEAVEKRVISS